jgi:hypothetical protein
MHACVSTCVAGIKRGLRGVSNKVRRVVQPRDDLVEDWMGNGVFGDVNGVGTAARYTVSLAIVVMANNTFAFVVEGQAISQINVAASLKSAFVGLNFLIPRSKF